MFAFNSNIDRILAALILVLRKNPLSVYSKSHNSPTAAGQPVRPSCLVGTYLV